MGAFAYAIFEGHLKRRHSGRRCLYLVFLLYLLPLTSTSHFPDITGMASTSVHAAPPTSVLPSSKQIQSVTPDTAELREMIGVTKATLATM